MEWRSTLKARLETGLGSTECIVCSHGLSYCDNTRIDAKALLALEIGAIVAECSPTKHKNINYRNASKSSFDMPVRHGNTALTESGSGYWIDA